MATYEEILAHDDLSGHRASGSPGWSTDRLSLRAVREGRDDSSEGVQLREVDQLARRAAVQLRARGLRPAEVVILLSSQTLEDVVGVLGCLYARAPFCLLPPPVDAPQAQRLRSALASSRARLVVLSASLSKVLGDKLPALLGIMTYRRWSWMPAPGSSPTSTPARSRGRYPLCRKTFRRCFTTRPGPRVRPSRSSSRPQRPSQPGLLSFPAHRRDGAHLWHLVAVLSQHRADVSAHAAGCRGFDGRHGAPGLHGPTGALVPDD